MRRNSAVIIEISTLPGTEAPFSPMWAAASPEGVCVFAFGVSEAGFRKAVQAYFKNAAIAISSTPHEALLQVLEYLSAARQSFSIPIDEYGWTPFQREVYRAVQQVPYGQTATYAEIAAKLRRPRAARAVGAANAANPLPLIIPCHRLTGSDGSLRGYGGAGGLSTKSWLLEFERRAAQSAT